MLTTKLTAIADAIRSKTGETATMTLADMPNKISGISPLQPSVEEYSQINDSVASYLAAANAAYTDDNGSSVSVISTYATGADAPVGKTLTTQSGTRFMQDETNGKGGKITNSIGGASIIYNGTPNHVMRYYVQSNGSIVDSGRVKPTGNVRMIKFSGYVKNCRDIGGWACDGGAVNYNLMYRSATMGAAEAVNADYAKNANIRYHIDLRNEATFESSPFGNDVYYKSYPLSAYYKNLVDLSQTYYTSMVSLLRGVFSAVTHGDGVIYHCSLGRDRTGTLTFILLALLGVAKKNIDIDYELSGFSSLSDAGTAPSRTRTDYNNLATYFSTFGMSTLRDNVVKWALKAGLTIDEINAYRKAAIDGSPATLNASDYVSKYTLTQTLTACTSSTAVTELNEGEALSISISPNSGKKMQSIAVTMGGTDITSSVVSGNVITIGSISGNVVITATAVAAYTNQIPLSTDTDGSIYNGVGYQQGYRLNSSGTPSAQDSTYITGFIPCVSGDTLHFDEMSLVEGSTVLSQQRIAFYNASKTVIKAVYWTATNPTYTDGYLTSLVVPTYSTAVAYARFGCYNIGSNSIITVNEEIT